MTMSPGRLGSPGNALNYFDNDTVEFMLKLGNERKFYVKLSGRSINN